MQRDGSSHVSEAGFTYIGILVAIVIMGLVLSVAGRVWWMTERRNREAQLLFAGDQIRMAISAYFANGHQYPQSLDTLLADDRSPVPKRYLRRLYPDPMTGDTDWQLIRASDGNGIMGVASRSRLQPFKRKGFSYVDSMFENSDCYCSWQFIYTPRRGYVLPPAAPTH
jgi:type II secretory pathway pseudopilin PulG